MAIREFYCGEHGRFEKIVLGSLDEARKGAECPYDLGENRYCGMTASLVEFSLPAKRNPEHGLVK